MSIKFCPIASGSSGNCVYIGAGDTHVLIDAGISGKRVEAGLKELGVAAADLSAIFVTHEHIDHISGLGILSRRYKLPIYATPKTWRFFERHESLGRVDRDNVRIIEPGAPCAVKSIEALAFDIPHDSSQPVGYSFFVEGHKIFVATDIGCITDSIRSNIMDASIIFIESNHDLEMLKNGPYPKVLKDRVMGSRGHLSNDAAGTLLSECASEKLRHIYLGHLSKENNLPLIALDTVRSILSANAPGLRIPLYIADRDCVSLAVELP